MFQANLLHSVDELNKNPRTLQSTRDPGPRLWWTQQLGRLPDLRDRKMRGPSPAAARPPLKKPLLCLLAPCSVPGADGRVFVENTVVNFGSFHIEPTQPITVIARKIKHKKYSKREDFSSSPSHEPQAPARRPTARNNSTPCHTGRGLAGHPQSVGLGSGDDKTRLYT